MQSYITNYSNPNKLSKNIGNTQIIYKYVRILIGSQSPERTMRIQAGGQSPKGTLRIQAGGEIPRDDENTGRWRNPEGTMRTQAGGEIQKER